MKSCADVFYVFFANFYNKDVYFENPPKEMEMAAGDCQAAQ